MQQFSPFNILAHMLLCHLQIDSQLWLKKKKKKICTGSSWPTNESPPHTSTSSCLRLVTAVYKTQGQEVTALRNASITPSLVSRGSASWGNEKEGFKFFLMEEDSFHKQEDGTYSYESCRRIFFVFVLFVFCTPSSDNRAVKQWEWWWSNICDFLNKFLTMGIWSPGNRKWGKETYKLM